MFTEKKLHFMHIPKTGGTSLFTFLGRQYHYREICPAYYAYGCSPSAEHLIPFSRLSAEKIQSYRLFMHHLGWLPRLFYSPGDIETITFLRDPVERFLSDFSHLCRDSSAFPHLSKQWQSIEAYLDDPVYDEFYKADIQARFFCSDLYSKPGLSYGLTDALSSEFVHLPFGHKVDVTPGKLLELATERLHSCAFVGITERYEESFQQLCRHYSWPSKERAQTLNVSSDRLRCSDLRAKTIDRIMELNQVDWQLYREGVKLFDERKRVLVACEAPKTRKSAPIPSVVPQRIDFNFEERFIGENWHVRESLRQDVYCWSSAAKATLIFLIQAKRDLLLRFRVLHFIECGASQALCVTVNDHPVRVACREDPKGGVLFEGVISRRMLDKKSHLLELAFTLPAIRRPKDIYSDTSDSRALGMACHSVRMIPLGWREKIMRIFIFVRRRLLSRLNGLLSIVRS